MAERYLIGGEYVEVPFEVEVEASQTVDSRAVIQAWFDAEVAKRAPKSKQVDKGAKPADKE